MEKINKIGEGKTLRIISDSPQFTRSLGKLIGLYAEAGDIICLEGELGAGKTCLVSGIAEGLGINEGIFSPSFIIVAVHRGKLPLFHIDLYRLEEGEITELGLEDYLYDEGVCAIEWAEKAKPLIFSDHLWVNISYQGNDKRLLTFQSRGNRYDKLLEELREFARLST
ncbi:tRNA (adenosine(37)-N6)-threonylcarbamoyltransferase complex ATPase subunit type 1 TsaE [bacterium]|nr:tRNA (adenosine(37)-N6)-threonylcarbamoyltransferase complex ATPase subunit type 1 TsaE [bacterium]